MTRGQWGRRIALAEIALAIAGVIALGFLWLMAPSSMGGGLRPSPAVDALHALAAAGLVVGFAWMIRIYRATPEPDPHIWRYRDRR